MLGKSAVFSGRRAIFARGALSGCGGFTVVEMMTVLVIIFILVVMLLEGLDRFRGRAEQAKCISNLGSLYVGVTGYMQEQEHWPQIDPHLITQDQAEYARRWFEALAPYNIPRITWACPTVQSSNGNPDLTIAKNMRADYLATPFDSKPRTPYRWNTQPWFIEKTSSHPGGNLMIFEDGSCMSLTDAVKRIPPPTQ